jgi:hypothetical protein
VDNYRHLLILEKPELAKEYPSFLGITGSAESEYKIVTAEEFASLDTEIDPSIKR